MEKEAGHSAGTIQESVERQTVKSSRFAASGASMHAKKSFLPIAPFPVVERRCNLRILQRFGACPPQRF
jgi:hypothetical protein